MAIDWQSRVTSLNALTLAGADASNRSSMVSRLNEQGTKYDSARTALGAAAVDAAKTAGDNAFSAATTAWSATASPTHSRADAMARYILGSGSVITFVSSGANAGALLARLGQADAALVSTPNDPKYTLLDELRAHTGYVSQAYAARPVAPSYGPPYTTLTTVFGTRYGYPFHSIYSFELVVLQPLVDEADLLLAELAFT